MIKVSEVIGFEPLKNASLDWDARVEKEQLGPAHTLDWLEAIHRTRALGQKLFTRVAVRDDKIVGLAPFVVEPAKWHGLPLRALTPLTEFNQLHGTQFIADGDSAPEAVDALLESIAANPAWDIWTMYVRAGEEQARLLELSLRQRGIFFIKEAAVGSPYLSLPDTWDKLQAGLQSRFRTTLRSRERGARDAAQIELRFHTTPDDMTAALAHVEQIEASSWKSHSGLPITHPKHWAFYRQLALSDTTSLKTMIVVLFVNGAPAAFDYAVAHANTYYLLQTSFQENMESIFPGLLLRKLVIEKLIADGYREIDFGTGDTEWKSKWTKQVRPHERYTMLGRTARARIVQLGMTLKSALNRGKQSSQR